MWSDDATPADRNAATSTSGGRGWRWWRRRRVLDLGALGEVPTDAEIEQGIDLAFQGESVKDTARFAVLVMSRMQLAIVTTPDGWLPLRAVFTPDALPAASDALLTHGDRPSGRIITGESADRGTGEA